MPDVEFGNKAAADAIREQFEEHLCPDDDARLKTVTFRSDAPDDVMEQARLEAEDSKAGEDSSTEDVPLTDSEKNRIEFGKGRASVVHARWVKGIAQDAGVSDWLAWYDPTLTVDEHREVMERAATEGGGRRHDNQDSATEKAAEAAQTAKGGQCDHARDHCEHGDPEACEFLTETCGYSQEEADDILGLADRRDQGDDTRQTDLVTIEYEGEALDVTPEQAGAIRRAWRSYKAGVNNLDRLLAEVREEVITSRQAFRTINRIRGEEGQDDLHPDRLHDLLDALASMPGDIPEVRTLDHYADLGTSQDLGEQADAASEWEGPDDSGENVTWRLDRDKMDGGTLVLSVSEQDRARNYDLNLGFMDLLQSVRLAVEPSESGTLDRARQWLDQHGANPPVDPDEVIPIYEGDRRGQFGPITDPETAAYWGVKPTETPDQADDVAPDYEASDVEINEQFANEQQGTLGVNVEAEQAAEEKQVTLTGADEAKSPGALPAAWRREGDTWHGGRYSVQMDGDRHSWSVRLLGPADTFDVATRLGGPVEAEAVAQEFTDRVAPDEVSMKSSDGTIQEAAAAAKQAALDDEGGILDYQ